MIRCLKGLLAVLMLLTCALPSAVSEAEDGRVQAFLNMLTEVYGFTQEEAENLEVTAEGSGTDWHAGARDPLAPDMVYICECTENPHDMEYFMVSGHRYVVKSPLYGLPMRIRTGEGNVREGLRLALKNGWFTSCSGPNRAELRDWIENHCGLSYLNQAALEKEDVASMDAVHLFFEACFGERWGWNQALKSWEKAVMLSCGTPETYPFLPEIGIEAQVNRLAGKSTERVLMFQNAWPDEGAGGLEKVEELKDKQPVCGAVKLGKLYSRALIVVEDQGKRVLVRCGRNRTEENWEVCPCGSACLIQQGSMDIVPLSMGDFEVRMADGDGKQIHIVLTLWGATTDGCNLQEVRMLDEDGEKVRIFRSSLSAYAGGAFLPDESGPCHMPTLVEYLDLDRFPEERAEGQDTGRYRRTIGEVHFRRDHSSHSADLGTLSAGAVFEILGTEPGTESEWYQAKIGNLTGWVSGNYTREMDASGTMPAAAGGKSVTMYENTGIFPGRIGEIAPGEIVWVFLRRGGWLYVMKPGEDTPEPENMEGTFGWVREKDVKIAASPAGLVWVAR